MKKVLSLGMHGFPRPSAEVEKLKLILKVFIALNYSSRVLCNKNYYVGDYSYRGNEEGIEYFYTTFTFNKKNKLENRIRQLLGSFVEIFIILKYNPNIVIITSRSFLQIIKYVLFSKITGAKILLTHVEDISSVSTNTFPYNIHHFFFNKYAFRLVDGALPISDYLYKKIKKNAITTPVLKLPVMVDYKKFIGDEVSNKYKEIIESNYFLYCGSSNYEEVIYFIKNCYDNSKSNCDLILILNGQNLKIENIKSKCQSEKIKILNNLGWNDLVSIYKSAKALLIPLRETIQDKARFPHKIGEYCAAGKPIITNNWGEIPYYFTHMNNAIICDNYSIEEFSRAMKFVENNPLIAEKIGNNAKLIAKNIFDYHNFINPLKEFIKLT